MTCRGKVKDGVVVLEDPKALPEGMKVRVQPAEQETAGNSAESEDIWESLLELAGTVKGLPSDMARNHDHYIHGKPKK